MNLQDLVKSQPNNAKVKTDFATSMQAVDEAITALPSNERSSPSFVLQVVSELLDAANSEYGAAIANNKVTAPIEYQDSRGFVVYADSLYQSIASQMTKDNPAAHKEIETNISELIKAWPAAVPPAAPIKTPDQVVQLVKMIEQNSKTVIRQS